MDMFSLQCSSDGIEQLWTLPLDMAQPHLESLIADSDVDIDRIGMPITVPDENGPYVLTISSLSTNPNHIVSTLLLTAENYLNQQTISCSGSSVTIQFQGKPG